MQTHLFTMKRVLILRPQPGADETAATLIEMGHVPVVFPIGRIEPLEAKIDAKRGPFAAVAATSVNGLRHVPVGLLSANTHLPFFAVGPATGEAARRRSFTNVIEGRTDGTELARMIIDRRPAGSVLYLCGAVRRPEFEAALEDAGIETVAVETYLASYPDLSGEFSALVDVDGLPDTVLVHSPEAGRAFDRLVTAAGVSLDRVTIIAISARAAQPFLGRGCRIVIAGQPNEPEMIAALAR